ncbi:MAG: aspartate dehydrogenase domain-containing protein, partial [Pseudomonadota bacterium]
IKVVFLPAELAKEAKIEFFCRTEFRGACGTAREAARGFPANVNVAAALSLAGIGPDRTTVEVWADPTIDRNMQSVRVTSESADAEMSIRNVPSAENPRTGKITALSVIACLDRMTAPLVAGT